VFAIRAERSYAQIGLAKVGFYPVREPDASFTLSICYSTSLRIFKNSLNKNEWRLFAISEVVVRVQPEWSQFRTCANERFQATIVARGSILSAAERRRVLALPDSRDERNGRYTLSESDLSIIRQRRGAANRLGFAVQLCYLGVCCSGNAGVIPIFSSG